MPGWLSWLERTAHRVTKRALTFFLGYREAAGSNPAPGILQSQESLHQLFLYNFSKIQYFIGYFRL